jgi:glycosyltransferase involved in cell wall biosynthesis
MDKTIRIIVPLYNSGKYVTNLISSITSQNYSYFKCYIFDDMSTDNSVNIIKNNIKDDDRFEIITNKEKFYSCGNHWQAFQNPEINDDDVCITIDGDDWLADNYVLDRVNCYYYDNNILISFGQFNMFNGKDYIKGFTRGPNWKLNVRKQPWTFSHMRTFKALVGRKIKKEDLISPLTNSFWPLAGDLALIFPMLEMCGEKRTLFVDDINYIYNIENSLNEAKLNLHMVMQYDALIRQKKEYQLI